MLNIIPAIDILNGNVVRLYKGDYKKVKVYEVSVEKQILLYRELGVTRVHIVDLDGAKEGKIINAKSIEKALSMSSGNFDIEVGGGIRTIEDIKYYIDMGVKYVILGTKAINDFDFLKMALSKFSDNIIVGLDVKNNKPAVSGWTKTIDMNIESLFKTFEIMGVKSIIYTDISTDGTLSGLNIDNIKYNLSLSNMKYIVSGGVASIKDIENLLEVKNKNLEGVIIGKALYDGRLDLKETLELLNKRT